MVLGAALCALWFRIADVGQPVVAPVFVVLFPVVATFWVVSRKGLAHRFVLASFVALTAAFVTTVLGLILGVNLGVLGP